MTHALDDGLAKAFSAALWLLQPAELGDVIAVLSDALGADWVVERETDYTGEMSIIAFPASDQDARPTFVLYEADGQTHVATIRGDEWASDHGFNRFRQGVDAIIAAAKASPSVRSQPTTSRSDRDAPREPDTANEGSDRREAPAAQRPRLAM
jgi:hypothetical protein